MKITFTLFVDQPHQPINNLMRTAVNLAEEFAEILNKEKFQILKGFEVSSDTEKTIENSKINGVPYELLKQLPQHCKPQ